MKKVISFFFFFLLIQSAFAQEKSDFPNPQFSIDFGSFRNRYLYPITNLKYVSPLLKKVNVKFSARLRSYGTLYFFSKSAYDFTPQAEYYFTKEMKPLYFSAGLGAEVRLRFVGDPRSFATSSVQPIFSLSFHGNYKKIYLDMPLWTRFYSNGISLALLPEFSVHASNSISIFLREEVSYLSIYKMQTHEWRQDVFLGVKYLF